MRLFIATLIVPSLLACASASTSNAPTPAELPGLEARLTQTPNDAVLAVRVAQGYLAVDRNEDARILLERTLTTHPNNAPATALLGIAYEDMGRFGDARRLYRSYIEKGPAGKLRNELTQRLPLLQRKELAAQAQQAIAREAELANTPPTPWTVAVMPFAFLGDNPDYAPLGRALAEMMVTDLSQTSRLRVLERMQVQLLIDEMKLAEQGIVDPATAARTGRMLGAERVVQGSIDGSDNSMQLATSVVRVGANAWPGEAADNALTEQDAMRSLVAMQKRLALRMYESLGIQLTPAERERVSRRATENVMAILAYGRGLQAEDAGNYQAAAMHFAQAAKLDPNFTEAKQSEARVEAEADAAAVPTNELAMTAVAPPGPTAAQGAPEFFLPNAMQRDKAAEILRTEGTTSTVLELIIKRPQ
jgi:TolB-like protein